MRPRAAQFLFATATVLFVLPSATPEWFPIPAGSAEDPTLYPSPHELAFAHVVAAATDAARFPERSGSSVYFTRDQMAAVLAHLHRAELFPQGAGAEIARAQEIWDAAQTAYNPTTKFYDVTLDADALCINLEPNAWAMLATDRLANATGRPDIKTRVDEVAATLESAVSSGRANGVERCSERPSHWPFPLWSLFERARLAGDATALSVATARLRSELAAHFEAEAFSDDPGFFFLAESNAIYLLVLQSATRQASASEFQAKRDALAAFLANEALRPDGDELVVYTVEKSDEAFQPTQPAEPPAYLWLAYALHQQDLQAPSTVTLKDAPERILSSLLDRAWSYDQGGLVDGTGRANFLLSSLLATFTDGPAVTGVSSESPRLTIVVPSDGDFTYLRPHEETALRYHFSNQWVFRFTLEPRGPPAQTVRLPLDRLGPLHLGHPESPYTPLPDLERSTDVAASVHGGLHPALDFFAPLAGPETYRLTAYAPIFAESSSNHDRLSVRFLANASSPITVGLLRAELEMWNITVESVRFDGDLLAPGAFDLKTGATEAIEEPHLRLELRDLTFPPQRVVDLVLTYSDTESPTVGSPTVSLSPDGRNPVSAEDGEFRVATQSTAWVRVNVRDNAALRSVVLRQVRPGGFDEHPMEQSPDERHVWRTQLPRLGQNDRLGFQIYAVDEQSNINPPVTFSVQFQSSFLQEGNLILLVFAATLFVVSVVVFLRMGKKRRAP